MQQRAQLLGRVALGRHVSLGQVADLKISQVAYIYS